MARFRLGDRFGGKNALMARRRRSRDFDLLVRYVAGECRIWESDEIRARLSVDENLAARMREIDALWNAPAVASRSGNMPEDELERFKSEFFHRVRSEGNVHSLVSHQRMGSQSPIRVINRADRMPIESGRRVDMSSSGRVLGKVMLVLACMAIAGLFSYREWVWTDDVKQEKKVPDRVIETGIGQMASIKLVDGTMVRLSVASKLTVPSDFSETHRMVHLVGEAFFEVDSDPAHPFLITTRDAHVRVHGTSFDVRAYTDDRHVQVVVTEGEVSVWPSKSILPDTVRLQAKDLVRISGSRIDDFRRHQDVSRYLAWKEGRLVFYKAPFDEVVQQLERWYDLQIDVRGSTHQIARLNTSFSQESLSEILNIISRALSLNYEVDGRHVVFSPSHAPPAS